MKIVHGNKLAAIMEMKLKALFSKNFIIMPIFAIGFTLVMKIVYSSMLGGEDVDVELTTWLNSYVLSLGALMNITMTGIYCVSAALAEEKEKHTLRALMTSSVNGLEFFLGSLIPVILMMTVVNAIIVIVSGMSMSGKEWGVYLSVSALCAIASAVIGMIFGIFSKNQVTAGTITTPALLIFMMIPIFSAFNDIAGTITNFLFTGVIMATIQNIASGEEKILDIFHILVLFVEIVIAVICFLAIYQKNGYDTETV